MNLVPLEQLSFEAFAKARRTNFRVWISNADLLELELCEITQQRIFSTGGAGNQAFENFALVFRGPAEHPLPQGNYSFESAALGRFELFIVPVGLDQNGMSYEAVFNRLIRSDRPRA